MKPVLFVTGHAPADRIGAFALLDERENVEFALFGGRLRHGGSPPPTAEPGSGDAASGGGGSGDVASGDAHSTVLPVPDLPFPHNQVHQRALFGLASSGRYRAVVCSTGGRIALPATWAGARAAPTPLILWASLWSHPKTLSHAASYPALRRLYRTADAVVTYGPHVSAYVERRGARNVHIAPQAVDNDFWRAPPSAPPKHPDWPAGSAVKFLFVGRPAREKGIAVLLSAWHSLDLPADQAALVFVGAQPLDLARHSSGAHRLRADHGHVAALGPASPAQLRNFYAAADVLVLPSIRTRTFLEPWGLVVNEAFDRQLPVIASDAVGAVAGGLVRDGRNGIVVAAGDRNPLARAMASLAADPQLRQRMGAAGAADVAAYSYSAWAGGFSAALATLDRSIVDAAPGAGSVPSPRHDPGP